MGLTQRGHLHDVEVGRKEGETKRRHDRSWNPSKTPLRYRKRRVLFAIAIIALLCFAAEYLLRQSDYSAYNPADDYYEPSSAYSRYEPAGTVAEPKGPPPASQGNEDQTATSAAADVTKRNYNGKIKFFRLAQSLQQAASSTYRFTSRNVLFAFSDYKSASIIIPMACEMAQRKRNYVHIAIMSGDDVPLDKIRALNGVDHASCAVFWHDARPDFNTYSSDIRAEASVTAALGHIYSFIMPEVLIMDDSVAEAMTFVRGVRAFAAKVKLAVIEIPQGQSGQLSYLTRLDTGSLKAWHIPSVDIMIHAHASASGSLIRLLKSLKKANYAGLKPPRLIIDLPPDVDPPALQFLQSFKWTPTNHGLADPLASSLLIVRHRVLDEKMTAERAAVQFLESFYSVGDTNSHVLVLSTNAQVAASYYHYVRYALLEYLHSAYSMTDSAHLIGLSLETPQSYLNGTTGFTPPGADLLSDDFSETFKNETSVPFTWEAPNSNAALYLGGKWTELHSFVTHRMAAQKERGQEIKPSVAPSSPFWLEYILELMRARGYFMLYPGVAVDSSLVTIHDDLAEAPEEIPEPDAVNTDGDKLKPPLVPADGILAADDFATPRSGIISTVPLSQPLHQALPFDGELLELEALPHLLHSGDQVTAAASLVQAREFAFQFRREVGQCTNVSPGKRKKVVLGAAKDLFCFGDEIDQDFEDLPPETGADDEAEATYRAISRASTRTVPWLPDTFPAQAVAPPD